VEWALLAGLAKQPEARPSPRQLTERLGALTPAEWDVWFASRRIVPDAVQATTAADVTQTKAASYLVPVAATPGSRPSLETVPTSNSPQLGAASSAPWRSRAVDRRMHRARIALLICALLVGVLVGLAGVLVARQL
jgi:hypothetical protein